VSWGGWRGGRLSSPQKVSKFLSKPGTACGLVGLEGGKGGGGNYHASRRNKIEY